MITLEQYWMGRDKLYANDLTPEIEFNARDLLERVNILLSRFGLSRGVSSGWRPAAINARTKNAALHSKHITAQAIDIEDVDGKLDSWCVDNVETLVELGLWLEDPGSTAVWCHLQSVPPKFKSRIFKP